MGTYMYWWSVVMVWVGCERSHEIWKQVAAAVAYIVKAIGYFKPLCVLET